MIDPRPAEPPSDGLDGPPHPRGRWERLLHFVLPDRPASWRDLPRRLWPTTRRILRLTVATVLAYLACLLVPNGATDLTGALTALLVVQATAFSTVRMAMVRVGAVLTGILVAIGVSTVVGLTWWSLFLAVFASLALAELFHLGEQSLETAISAMLILAVSNPELAGEQRIVLSLIGAAVGMAVNFAVPPKVPAAQAISAVRQVGIAGADGLRETAASLRVRPVLQGDVDHWLDRSRTVAAASAAAAEVVAEFEEGRRLNPWAPHETVLGPQLRTGLEALEDAQFAVRALWLIMRREAPVVGTPDDGYGDEVRAAFALVLEETARCLESFGWLIQAEAEGRVEEAETGLAAALERVRETRAILTDLFFVDARSETSLWLLRGSILTAVEHVLDRLDVAGRAQVRSTLAEEAVPPRLIDTILRREWLRTDPDATAEDPDDTGTNSCEGDPSDPAPAGVSPMLQALTDALGHGPARRPAAAEYASDGTSQPARPSAAERWRRVRQGAAPMAARAGEATRTGSSRVAESAKAMAARVRTAWSNRSGESRRQ